MRYRTVADNLRVKEVAVGDGDAAQRFIVCHNPVEAEREQARREHRNRRIETELARLKAQRERAQTKAERDAHQRGECVLRDHKTLSRYLRHTNTGRLVLDRDTIKAEQRLDGEYLLTTSDPSLSAEYGALGCKQLLEAERSFRDLKRTLLLRPVFHRNDERIRAHVPICFLALAIIRVAEHAPATHGAPSAQSSARSAKATSAVATASSELRDLHRALQIPEPPSFGQITPV